jgi:hypothetical protein
MAPGFILLVTGMWEVGRRLRGRQTPSWLWVAPVVTIAVVYALALHHMADPQMERGWFMRIMGLAGVGNIGLIAILIAISIRYGKWGLAILRLVYHQAIYEQHRNNH